MSGSFDDESPFLGSSRQSAWFIWIEDPLEPKLLSFWISPTQCLWHYPHVWFAAGLGTLFTYFVAPKRNPPPIVSRPAQKCVRKVDILDLTKNHEFPVKSQIIASSCFQWSMQDLGCLMNITNFEFLCRKLHFVYAGIVQHVIVFIKSARHFRKTISPLASQRVACIPVMLRPTAMHFWIWELTMMWRAMQG